MLFADEPTACLHQEDRGHLLRTLTAAARSHRITVVLATHDDDVAALADRTVSLVDGRRTGSVQLADLHDPGRPGEPAGPAGAAEPDGPGSAVGLDGAEGRDACSLSV